MARRKYLRGKIHVDLDGKNYERRNREGNKSESSNSAVSYVDGNEIEGLFCSRIYYTQASGAPYRYQITYQRLGDGEKTWSAEEIMLKPTDYSRDALSCYDPGVAQWGNYYYLGYTSTKDTS